MNFREMTLENLVICAEQLICLDCPIRVGCRTRYSFYNHFNEHIELSNALAQQFGVDPKYSAFLKYKRLTEIISNPVFSYK